MRNKFDRELEDLNLELVQMGGMIETAISKTMTAMKQNDTALAQQVIDEEMDVNKAELSIERRSLRILLSEQPVARDLRAISTALKMITDMERICDQASDIADIVIQLDHDGMTEKPEHIMTMAQKCVAMVTRSIDAFVNSNLELAKQIAQDDDEVDALFLKVRDEITSYIMRHPEKSKHALDYFMIAKYLERIGDHAENISEWVVFNIVGYHKDERIL